MRSVFLTRLLTPEILFSNSVLSVSYLVFKTNSVVKILFTLVTNSSYASFLTTSFLTTALNLLKSTGTGSNLSTYQLQVLN